MAEAFRLGYDMEELFAMTKIDRFFLYQIKRIIDMEERIKKSQWDLEVIQEAKALGFSDMEIAHLLGTEVEAVEAFRKDNSLYPVYKMVDTCAAEFASETPYYYGTYEDENESKQTGKEAVLVLGSGPIRIGQGIEFDYATVHTVKAIQEAGYEAIIINNNPETVSTDFQISDKLYFEPLTVEDVMHVIRQENPIGVIVQFGGQTALNLASDLEERGVKLLGTSLENMDRAENRDKFEQTLMALEIPQPEGKNGHIRI